LGADVYLIALSQGSRDHGRGWA